MVSVAQLVEPRIVIPVVVGSSPIVHPIHFAEFGADSLIAIFDNYRCAIVISIAIN